MPPLGKIYERVHGERREVRECDAYTEGLLDGIERYAWWKNGTMYVGTTGTTFRAARARVLRERGYETDDEETP